LTLRKDDGSLSEVAIAAGTEMAPNNGERDRAIFAAYEAGAAIETLANEYSMSVARVRAVLTCQRHKRAVSPEPIYQQMRMKRA
jgi:Mor family transcriptional regulator